MTTILEAVEAKYPPKEIRLYEGDLVEFNLDTEIWIAKLVPMEQEFNFRGIKDNAEWCYPHIKPRTTSSNSTKPYILLTDIPDESVKSIRKLYQ